ASLAVAPRLEPNLVVTRRLEPRDRRGAALDVALAASPRRDHRDAGAARAGAALPQPARVRPRLAVHRVRRAGGVSVVQRQLDLARTARGAALSSLRVRAAGARH